MDIAAPYSTVALELQGKLNKTLQSAFGHVESEEIVGAMFDLAQEKGKWTPIHVAAGQLQDGVRVGITTAGRFRPEADELAKKGLVVVRELGGNNFAVEPTAALVELMRKHLS